MTRVTIRVLTAACFVVAVLVLAATAAHAARYPGDGCTPRAAADHGSHLLIADGRDSRHHRLIRHGRSGSRQTSSAASAVAPTARLDARASRIKARRARVPALHLLVNLVVPRAPASSLL